MQKTKPSQLKLGIIVSVIVASVFTVTIVSARIKHAHSSAGAVLGAFTVKVPSSATPIDAAIAPSKLYAREVAFNLAPELNAKSALVYDSRNDAVIFSKSPQKKLQIASLTKLMTAVVASESKDFDTPIVVASNDQLNVAPALHLQVGDKVLPRDLLNAMLVGSANDAAQTLANHFPDRKAFIEAMNRTAQQLGMNDTHFTTPIGFDDPNNYSTARDLQKLVDYALAHLEYENLWQAKDYVFEGTAGIHYAVHNSNQLVSKHANIRSVKTGQTAEALGNMIVLANNDSGNEVISIVLGSQNRNKDTLSLVDYIFQSFSWQNDLLNPLTSAK